jgi:hypothetical protein
MSRSKSRELYDLIKSLDKNEKRYFKLSVSKSGNQEEVKMLQLFDLVNKQKEFSENKIADKIPGIKVEQISNIKAYLHEKILQSLRQYHLSRMPDIKVREQIDFSQLLLERRQYQLAASCLKKAAKMAQQIDNLELQLEILKIEKEVLLESVEPENTVDKIIEQVRDLNNRINNINTFSNLAVKLNSFYRRLGFIRDQESYIQVKQYFYSNLPSFQEEQLSATEKLHLYRLFAAYYFFIQDFDNGYLYARKLENEFNKSLTIIKSHPELYLTSLNTVLNAEFKLGKYQEFIETTQKLDKAKALFSSNLNYNLRLRLQKYFFIHKINLYFLKGEFDQGVQFFENLKDELGKIENQLDTHSSLILSYKMACLYFGAAKYNQCIRWLNKVINTSNADIREDLHCFARILNLICHYELKNFDVIGYYIISTYRFLLKKGDLKLFQKYILKFLKNLGAQEGKELHDSFINLKAQLLPINNNPFEKRAFIYFDIISWLESKIEHKPVQSIIQGKFKFLT